jgi:Holliday junction resolvase RusA-like endonuclease
MPEPSMVLKFPAPAVPRSVNDEPRSVRARIARTHEKQAWRDRAYYATCATVRSKPDRARGPSEVRVTIPFATSRRRDPHNYTTTVVKPIIDGMRLAGVWPDDNADWVEVRDSRLVVGGPVIVTVTPR